MKIIPTCYFREMIHTGFYRVNKNLWNENVMLYVAILHLRWYFDEHAHHTPSTIFTIFAQMHELKDEKIRYRYSLIRSLKIYYILRFVSHIYEVWILLWYLNHWFTSFTRFTNTIETVIEHKSRYSTLHHEKYI